MRYAIGGLVALSALLMGGGASAHSDHVHVGKVWVPKGQLPNPGVMSNVLGGGFVTYMTGGIDCNHKEGYRGCGDCYPNCYLGTPCQCCVHKVHYTIPGTKFGKLHKQEVCAGNGTAIKPPGLCARLTHRTTLQRR